MNNYYVYAWKNIQTEEVFYVGMGKNNRINVTGNEGRGTGRNKYFREYYNTHDCVPFFIDVELTKEEAEEIETQYVMYYHSIGQCNCNSTWNGKRTGAFGERNGNWHNGNKLKNTYKRHPELKERTKHVGTDNGRARKIIAYYNNHQYEFEMVKDAAQWMIDNNISKSTVLAIMSAIASSIKHNKKYCSVKFKYKD